MFRRVFCRGLHHRTNQIQTQGQLTHYVYAKGNEIHGETQWQK